ncbi:flagellar hook-length control protein FliK [Larsenimonas rhizosphaerae]|uniref:flagellar hook-length control protein FliK n=1 Tax=Larsenimonas rhizosphaerae TaxID=2944682 RepID=UPI002033AB9F|nr:flagellar hook-length control protein FliK [Larsenimonas rhizosphaerae]MCM2130413.1 flagellar hook-length control protein FliK [Larsenimonas rhizosphaerae]
MTSSVTMLSPSAAPASSPGKGSTASEGSDQTFNSMFSDSVSRQQARPEGPAEGRPQGPDQQGSSTSSPDEATAARGDEADSTTADTETDHSVAKNRAIDSEAWSSGALTSGNAPKMPAEMSDALANKPSGPKGLIDQLSAFKALSARMSAGATTAEQGSDTGRAVRAGGEKTALATAVSTASERIDKGAASKQGLRDLASSAENQDVKDAAATLGAGAASLAQQATSQAPRSAGAASNNVSQGTSRPAALHKEAFQGEQATDQRQRLAAQNIAEADDRQQGKGGNDRRGDTALSVAGMYSQHGSQESSSSAQVFSSLLQQSSGTSQQMAAPGSVAAQAATYSGVVNESLGTQGWNQSMGQHVIRMSHQGMGQAELHLNPRDLGPLSISLKMDDQGAQAHFFSANAHVRAAVESALPQLKEAMADNGISLGQTSVNDQQGQPSQQFSFNQSSDQQGNGRTSGGDAGIGEADVVTTADDIMQRSTPASRPGGVDLFA